METPKEVKEWAERIMSLKRKTCIEDIVDYFNTRYKNATIKYEEDRFIIDGDENESLEIAEDLKDMLNFSAKKD